MSEPSKKTSSPGRDLLSFTVPLRRDFHAHPELGLEEHRTQGVVIELLRELGIPYREVGGTGVLGTVDSGRDGPVILLRADMDALPVTEENEAPYASRNPGIMHACGHDAHMAILLGTAKHFAENGVERGILKLLFQPGEEGKDGARKVIADGVLEDPPVDSAFGIHVWRDLPAGRVAVLDGPCMAAVDTFEIRIRGRGGHAAYPHLSRDPVTMAAQVLSALQTIVSRDVDPLDTAVVTVGSLHAGTTFNVIPDSAVLRGTCRTFRRETRTLVHSRVEEVASGIASALGGTAEIEYREFLPATVNDPEQAALAREAAVAAVGAENVVPAAPSMGGEDMSLYLEQVKGCFAFVGLRNEERGIVHPHHHARFDLDESCLAAGVDLMIEYVGRRGERRS